MVKDWYWNELQHSGTDYGSIEEVERYDRRMAELRDIAGENRAILAALSLSRDAALIEIGTGTGALAITAARECRHVVAMDVSPVMLAYAEAKAKAAGTLNIDFHQGGFLTHQYSGPPADAVVSCLALHHLPDFWKSVALDRTAALLKPGGLFYLMDVVFSFQSSPEEFFPVFFERLPEIMKPNTVNHVAREYSTFDWVMRGLLERAGFEIEKAELDGGWLARYLCRRPLTS